MMHVSTATQQLVVMMHGSTVTLNTLWIPHTVLDRSAGWLKIPEEIPVKGAVMKEQVCGGSRRKVTV